MTFNQWLDLVKQAGADIRGTDPNWLQQQFNSGISPAIVVGQIKSGQSPQALKPVKNATPRQLNVSKASIVGGFLALGLLWYNFGPLPASWTSSYRNEQARVQAIQDKLNPTPSNQAEIERLEFEKAATADAKKYKDRLDEIIAKWKTLERERPRSKEELEQSIKEVDDLDIERKIAAREFELKWRKEHPNTKL